VGKIDFLSTDFCVLVIRALKSLKTRVEICPKKQAKLKTRIMGPTLDLKRRKNRQKIKAVKIIRKFPTLTKIYTLNA
jgi:hypothetical protein